MLKNKKNYLIFFQIILHNKKVNLPQSKSRFFSVDELIGVKKGCFLAEKK